MKLIKPLFLLLFTLHTLFLKAQLNTDTDIDNKTINTTLALGVVAGGGGVDGTGNATYSIPIYTPTGIGSMQPAVSINYNSDGRNGLLGWGWSLNAVSMITYIAKDVWHDNIAEVAYINNGSPFVLDGQRLVLVSGIHGSNNATYRTEDESFSLITAKDGTNGRPDYFTVSTKNGIVMEYGRVTSSANSKLSSTINLPVVWFLSKSYDQYGNYIEYQYADVNGERVLDKIVYTQNAVLSGTLIPNEIKFTYTARTDPNVFYSIDTARNATERPSNNVLTAIDVKSEGSSNTDIVRHYDFIYGTDTLYTFLKEVKESNGVGEYKNSTIFKYGETNANTNVSLNIGSFGSINFYNKERIFGDFNGDGQTDICIATYNGAKGSRIYTKLEFYTCTNKAAYALAYTFTLPTSQTLKINGYTDVYTIFSELTVADIDGDGKHEIVQGKRNGITGYVKASYCLGFSTFTIGSNITYTLPSSKFVSFNKKAFIYAGDFNGDKIDEIYCGGYIYSNGIYYNYALDPDGDNDDVYMQTDSVVIKDLNNDGKEDLCFYGKHKIGSITNHTIQYYKMDMQNGSLFDYIPFSGDSITLASKDLYIGDFNGDNRNDKLEIDASTIKLYLYDSKNYSLVTTFTIPESVNFLKIDSSKENLLIDDFNGDGKDDLLHYYLPAGSATAKYAVYYCNGKNFKREVYDVPVKVKNFVPLYTVDLNNDGNADIIVDSTMNSNSVGYIVYIKPQSQNFLLTKIKDGYGRLTKFQYKHFSDGAIYSKGVNNYGDIIVGTPLNFGVFRMYIPDGSGNILNLASTQYQYSDACYHLHKGFLGFMSYKITNIPLAISTIHSDTLINASNCVLLAPNKTISVDNNSFIVSKADTVITFNYNTGDFDTSITLKKIAKVLSQSGTFYNLTTFANKRNWLKTVKVYSADSITNISSTSAMQYDTDGNVTAKYDTIRGGANVKQTASTTVTGFLSNGSWITYLPDIINSTINFSDASPSSVYTTQTDNNYDGKGQLIESVTFNNVASKKISTTNDYDAVTGILLKQTVTPAGQTARYTRYEYQDNKRTIKKTYTSMNSGEQLTQNNTAYDKRFGVPTTIQNGLYSNYQTVDTYDTWGRQTTSKQQVSGTDINTTTNAYAWDNATSYKVITTQTVAAPTQTVYYDLLDRVIKTSTQNFGGATVSSTTAYDTLGRVKTTTMPDAGTGTNDITTNYMYGSSSDYFKLLSVADNFSSVTYQYIYNSPSVGEYKTKVTKSTGTYKEQIIDATGKLIKSTDAGGTLTYSYNSQSKITKIGLDGVPDMNTMDYDAVTGLQTQLTDKNAGTTQYRYDNWGQLVYQKDQAGFEDTLSYDAIGRLLKKERKAKGSIGGEIVEYEYQTATEGKEQLSKIKLNGATDEQYVYDTRHRPVSYTKYIDNVPYTTTAAFTATNNIDSITYPQGFKLNYKYNTLGYLEKIQYGTKIIYQTNSTNKLNQPLTYTLGNGKLSTITYNPNGTASNYSTSGIQNLDMSFDAATGNLLSRTDNTQPTAQTESFTYKNDFDRLFTISKGSIIDTILYFDNGNIKQKSKIGTYEYTSPKINAVTKINYNCGAVHALDSFVNVVKYTPFSQPDSITEVGRRIGVNDSTKYVVSFTYGADHQRTKMLVKQGTTIKSTRYYNGNYEKLIDSAGTIRHIYYISGSNGLCCIATMTGTVTKFNYVYTDHLGSILKLTDSAGTIVGEQSFDAWGRERNYKNWSKDTITQPNGSPFANINSAYGFGNNSGWLTRGFTGHEHLPQFNLINMNGRLYDPIVGRMLSVDNNVADATNTQAYNKYSYVVNNPLKYTDPSGWKLKQVTEKNSLPEEFYMFGGGSGGGYINLSGYNYQAPYSVYADNPGYYTSVYGGTANWVVTTTTTQGNGMPNWNKGISSTMYYFDNTTTTNYHYFNASTHSDRISDGGNIIQYMNNATAGIPAQYLWAGNGKGGTTTNWIDKAENKINNFFSKYDKITFPVFMIPEKVLYSAKTLSLYNSISKIQLPFNFIGINVNPSTFYHSISATNAIGEFGSYLSIGISAKRLALGQGSKTWNIADGLVSFGATKNIYGAIFALNYPTFKSIIQDVQNGNDLYENPIIKVLFIFPNPQKK